MIDRSKTRDIPDQPVATYSSRPIVWNSSRGNHLGQRSCVGATKGRTYGRERSDQIIAQNPCEAGAVHIWLMLAVRDAIPAARDLARAEFDTLRLRLLKIAARVIETASRVRLAFAAACPEADLFRSMPAALMPAGP